MEQVSGEDRISAEAEDIVPGRLYLISLRDDENSVIEFVLMNDAFDLKENCPRATGSAAISVRGAGQPYFKPVLAAAVAVAIAIIQHTNIHDDAHNWTTDTWIKPLAFLARLAVNRLAMKVEPDIQAAAVAFCHGMNKPVA